MILLTTHCPKCKILKKKLEEKDIAFVEVDNVEVIKDKYGVTSVPVLITDDDEQLGFREAVEFVNNI